MEGVQAFWASSNAWKASLQEFRRGWPRWPAAGDAMSSPGFFSDAIARAGDANARAEWAEAEVARLQERCAIQQEQLEASLHRESRLEA